MLMLYKYINVNVISHFEYVHLFRQFETRVTLLKVEIRME